METEFRLIRARQPERQRGILGNRYFLARLEPFGHGLTGQQKGGLAGVARRLQPRIEGETLSFGPRGRGKAILEIGREAALAQQQACQQGERRRHAQGPRVEVAPVGARRAGAKIFQLPELAELVFLPDGELRYIRRSLREPVVMGRDRAMGKLGRSLDPPHGLLPAMAIPGGMLV